MKTRMPGGIRRLCDPHTGNERYWRPAQSTWYYFKTAACEKPLRGSIIPD